VPVLLVAAVSMAAVRDVATQAIPDPIPPGARLANAVVSCVRYVGLTLWPGRLSPWYSHPWFEGPPLTALGVGAATLALGTVSALVVAMARRAPYAPVGWFWYLGTLVPVLGLLYNGRQGMADRYAYIPHIGLFLAVTWAVADAPLWRFPTACRLGAVAVGIVLLLLGGRTAWQARVWRDDRTFWGYTVRVNPDSFIAHQALAGIMQNEGRPRDAILLYRRAARIRPELARVHVQLGKLLARTGRPGPAAAQLRKAVTLEPGSVEDRLVLAQVLVTQGRRASARRELLRVLAIKPDDPEAREALARLQ